MKLFKNVWEVCKFGEEIVQGRLELDRFAAELYAVLEGTASPVYQDPALFLSNTYPTSGMRYLLKEALLRLSGKGGDPVIVLDTEFGGGKSHLMILLLHLFNASNKELANNYIRDTGLDVETGVLEVPDVKLVAIDCRRIKKETLWGELASLCGEYELLEEEDKNRIPPRDIGKILSLLKGPTLILMDELPELLLISSGEKVGDTNLAELTIAFVMKLISAVANTPNSMLIISLTGKQTLYERYVKEFKKKYEELVIERIYDSTKQAMSRQARFLVPVEKDEVPHIIRKRLIKQINRREVERIAGQYFNYYRDKGLVEGPEYSKRIEECYPIHPIMVDILYDRVSSIEEFNRTRGVLRLIALLLHNIYRDRKTCVLLSPKDIDLSDPEIKSELTNKLKRNELSPVVETDCLEKAEKIDRRREVKIAQKIARTIFLYSLIGAEKISGIRPSDIKLAVCEPGIDPSLVDEVLVEMDKELWYLKEEAGTYYFTTEPNINKIINDYIKTVSDEDATILIKETLQSLSGGDNVIIWDEDQLGDSQNFKIFLLDYRRAPFKNDDIVRVAEKILETTSDGGVRTYRNTLAVVIPYLPSKEHVEELMYIAKMVKAIQEAKKDERIKMDKNKLDKINQRFNEAKGDLTALCFQTYSKIAYPRLGDGQIKISDLATIDGADKEKGTAKTIKDRVIKLLKKEGKYVEDRLSTDAILEIVKTSDKGRMTLTEIYDVYKRDRRRPIIRDGSLIIEAVRAGVKNGQFGYSNNPEEIDGRYLAIINKEISAD